MITRVYGATLRIGWCWVGAGPRARSVVVMLRRAITVTRMTSTTHVGRPRRVTPDRGVEEWWLAGRLHRTDGPAVTRPDGTQQWRVHGRLHRIGGPAVTWPDGTQEWRVDGQLHRVGGPAVEWSDGTRQWWVGGSRHRIDGPATTWPDGAREWWVEGRRIPDEVAAVAARQPSAGARIRALLLVAKAGVNDADDAEALICGVNGPARA